MLAVFAGKRPGRALWLPLLCFSLGLSAENSADGTMRIQDASQAPVNPLTKVQAGLNETSHEFMTFMQTVDWQTPHRNPSDHLTLGLVESTADAGLTTEHFKQTTKESMPDTVVKYEVFLPGVSGTSMGKNITLDRASTIELSCRLDKKYSHLKSLQMTWKKGNETIGHSRTDENSWSIQLSIVNNSNLGSYSCTLKGEEEFSTTFRLQVPKIEGKEKPTISYEGDTAILTCKSSGYTPIVWTWYVTNGSEQIAINDTLLPDKYVINRVSANVTYLKILKVTKEDNGVYWCEAAFELGKSMGKLHLKVLSLLEPLKPFLAIVAEVIGLVTVIFLYEVYSKKKEKCAESEKEFDQIEQLRSEEINGLENSRSRHIKSESASYKGD